MSYKSHRRKAFGFTASGLLQALRIAHLTPSNASLIFDINSSQLRPTPFGSFLLATTAAAEKIIRRNVAFTVDTLVKDDDARYWALQTLGLSILPAWHDEKKRSLDDFRVSGEELARLPRLLSPYEIIDEIDLFAQVSYAKEQSRHINDIIKVWHTFRIRSTGHPFFEGFVKHGNFLNDLADHGLEAVIEKKLRAPPTQQEVQEVLRIHEFEAGSHGTHARTQEILTILDKYKGRLRPFIIAFRKFAPQVVKDRRKEFGQQVSFWADTKADFLKGIGPELRMELYRRGFPILKLKAMAERGSFGQKPNDLNPHGISVEHMSPLTTSDNFKANFALMTAGANRDTNRLVQLQTDFLEADKVEKIDGGYTVSSMGLTIPIIALRPSFFIYDKDKKFPSFVSHPGWDWQKG